MKTLNIKKSKNQKINEFIIIITLNHQKLRYLTKINIFRIIMTLITKFKQKK